MKEKTKKRSIIVALLIAFIAVSGFAVNYLLQNYIGFTEVDLSDYVLVTYEKDKYVTYPKLTGNWIYYSPEGYYDDAVETLVESGIYTEDEAKEMMPKDESVLDVSQIVTNYSLSTENGVKNGDEVEVKILFDEEKAKELKLKVVNDTFKFTISGLYEIVKPEDITEDMMKKVTFKDEDALADSTYFGISVDFAKLDMKVVKRGYYLKTSESGESANLYYVIGLEEVGREGLDPIHKVASEYAPVIKTDSDIYVDDRYVDLDLVIGEYDEYDEFVDKLDDDGYIVTELKTEEN